MGIGQNIVVNDKFQTNYSYELSCPIGKNFYPQFLPYFTPIEMLELGVFEGKYCNDSQKEFPSSWFSGAKIGEVSDPQLNYFRVKSRQPLSFWRKKGWIYGPDPRGWFQWYCRYYFGRRIPSIDQIQIKRWKAFNRHVGQVRANCFAGDVSCRPRQRQALLQWSYDPFI